MPIIFFSIFTGNLASIVWVLLILCAFVIVLICICCPRRAKVVIQLVRACSSLLYPSRTDRSNEKEEKSTPQHQHRTQGKVQVEHNARNKQRDSRKKVHQSMKDEYNDELEEQRSQRHPTRRSQGSTHTSRVVRKDLSDKRKKSEGVDEQKSRSRIPVSQKRQIGSGEPGGAQQKKGQKRRKHSLPSKTQNS